MTEEELTYLKSVQVENDTLLDDLPEYDFSAGGVLMDAAGVKLHGSGPIMILDSRELYVDKGEHVIVETGRGLAQGEVVVATQRRQVDSNSLPRIVRKATAGDVRQRARNRDREDAAYRLCKDRIEKFGLPMKLIAVNYLHAGNKAVFYFSAEGRIDFRELVRDLSKRLHTRIEMRQIGVRDSTRMLGGIGICGCRLCCSRFIREFSPVSIRMAKDQNLVLNPQKVSGICGRLLCCLTYEDEVYRSAAKTLPRVGRKVSTPDGPGRVKDRDVLKGLVRVLLADDGGLKEYDVGEIRPANRHEPRDETEKANGDEASEKNGDIPPLADDDSPAGP